MSVVEDRKLQCVNHATDGVQNTAAKQKGETSKRYIAQKLREGKQTTPAHGNVNNGRYPFWTVDEKQALEDAHNSNAPHKGNKPCTGGSGQCQQANRSVSTGDQNINHQMVQFLKTKVALYRASEGMI